MPSDKEGLGGFTQGGRFFFGFHAVYHRNQHSTLKHSRMHRTTVRCPPCGGCKMSRGLTNTSACPSTSVLAGTHALHTERTREETGWLWWRRRYRRWRLRVWGFDNNFHHRWWQFLRNRFGLGLGQRMLRQFFEIMHSMRSRLDLLPDLVHVSRHVILPFACSGTEQANHPLWCIVRGLNRGNGNMRTYRHRNEKSAHAIASRRPLSLSRYKPKLTTVPAPRSLQGPHVLSG
jgi:hypothetical protein